MPSTLIQLLDALLGAYSLILLGKAIVSWFPVNPYNPIVRFLDRLTEPVLAHVRKNVPPVAGMDLSVVLVLVVISILRNMIWSF
ncbi:MAG: YggT family protein [bacterium]